MKKNLFFVLMVIFSVAICTQTFAASATNETTPGPGGTLTVDTSIPLNFNFSPSVAGLYAVEAATTTVGNEQWYAVGTYHQGGALFYGSASDQTTVFKRSRETNMSFSDAAVPEAPVVDADGNPIAWFSLDADGVKNTDDWYR